MLRLPVKVNSITNLSDARYCAGMGVEMLGFSISENHERSISIEKTNGITGWLAGVKIVAESYQSEKPETLIELANSISAEAIELAAVHFKPLSFPDHHLIVRLTINEWEDVKGRIPEDALLHIPLEKTDLRSLSIVQTICKERITLLNVTKLDLTEIERVLSETNPYGISHDGGTELSPGLSDFEHLAEVLEYLEA